VPELIEPISEVLPEAAAGTDRTSETTEPESAKASVTYLAAARNSARLAAETSNPEKKSKSWLYRIPRKYLVFTCALMSVVTLTIGVLVVQRASALAANAETISPRIAGHTAVHRSIAPRRLAVVSPLDELSALAAAGNGKAQLIVGLKYLKGTDGIAINPVEAARWIARAAQRGEPMAQYWAGYIYQHGVGVSADPDAALRWYEAAADQGNTKAMYNLGVGYAQGWGGAKDAPEASRWFARAARLGYVDAQFNLAVLYERGLGVPPNLSDAYKWYAIAAKSGDAESKKRLVAITTQLNADDLEAAQRSVLMFQPTPAVVEANTLPTIDFKRT
jgi:TPR repeat protein